MILLIDTSQEIGTVALSKEGQILFSEENKIAKEHASWLHLAIARLLKEAGITAKPAYSPYIGHTAVEVFGGKRIQARASKLLFTPGFNPSALPKGGLRS